MKFKFKVASQGRGGAGVRAARDLCARAVDPVELMYHWLGKGRSVVVCHGQDSERYENLFCFVFREGECEIAQGYVAVDDLVREYPALCPDEKE